MKKRVDRRTAKTEKHQGKEPGYKLSYVFATLIVEEEYYTVSE